MKKSTENIRAWKSVSDVWRSLKPPLRPSPGEIKIYEQFLKKTLAGGSSRRALLFGATPELRDLLAKYKFNVSIVDINPVMIKAMTKLLKRKNHQEKIIISDWLKVKPLKYHYDVVMGDQIFGNVKFEKWHQFCRIISDSLQPNGHLITNVILRFPVKGVFSFEKLINLYQKYPSKFNNIENKWQMLYKMMYSDKRFYSKKNYLVLWPAILQIQRALKSIRVNLDIKKIAKLADNIYVKEYKYSSPPRKVFESILGRHFHIINSDINRKHPVYRHYRIYLAKSI